MATGKGVIKGVAVCLTVQIVCFSTYTTAFNFILCYIKTDIHHHHHPIQLLRPQACRRFSLSLVNLVLSDSVLCVDVDYLQGVCCPVEPLTPVFVKAIFQRVY